MSIDPIRPYLPIIGLGLILLMILGGCSWGKSLQKGKDAAKIARKDQALTAANVSLTAAADALRAQNTANAQRVADAKQAQADASAAQRVADAESKRLAGQVADYEKLVLIAQRRPACKALLDSDVTQLCGL